MSIHQKQYINVIINEKANTYQIAQSSKKQDNARVTLDKMLKVLQNKTFKYIATPKNEGLDPLNILRENAKQIEIGYIKKANNLWAIVKWLFDIKEDIRAISQTVSSIRCSYYQGDYGAHSMDNIHPND